MSYARADFAHEEDSSQSTRRFREARSEAPIPPESPALFFPSLRLCLRNLVSKHAQLPLVEHGRIHHANQNLFDRTVAEPIDDALDSFRRNPSAWLSRMIKEVSAIHRVRRVALVFQPSQHGPNGRFLERTRKPFTHRLGRYRTAGPNQLHYLSFEVTQFGQALIHFLLPCEFCLLVTLQSVAHAATICNDDSIWNSQSPCPNRSRESAPTGQISRVRQFLSGRRGRRREGLATNF